MQGFFPGGSDGKESAAMWETRAQSLGREDLLKGVATCSSTLAWRIPMDRGAWWATVHGVAKGQTRLLFSFRGPMRRNCDSTGGAQ